MSGQEWLSVEAAAARLGLTQDAVRGRIKRGTLPAARRAHRVFVVLPRELVPAPAAGAPAIHQATNPATNPAATPPAGPATRAALDRLSRIAEERRRQIVALRDERDRLADQVSRQQGLLEREQRLREHLQGQLDRLSQGLSAAWPEATAPDSVEAADRLWRRLERQVRRLNAPERSKR